MSDDRVRFDAEKGDRGRVTLNGRTVKYAISGETGKNGYVYEYAKDHEGKFLVEEEGNLKRFRREGFVAFYPMDL